MKYAGAWGFLVLALLFSALFTIIDFDSDLEFGMNLSLFFMGGMFSVVCGIGKSTKKRKKDISWLDR